MPSVLLNFDQGFLGLKGEEMSFSHSDESQAAPTAVRWRCEGMDAFVVLAGAWTGANWDPLGCPGRGGAAARGGRTESRL